MNNEHNTHELNEDILSASGHSPFYILSLKKYWILNILTLGSFHAVWFFMQWLRQNQSGQQKVSPFWRTVFSIFFYHSLVENIKEQTEVDEIKNSWEGKVLATTTVILVIISSILDKVSNEITKNGISTLLVDIISWALFFVVLLLCSQIQSKINIGFNDIKGRTNDKITLRNCLWLVTFWMVISVIIIINVFN